MTERYQTVCIIGGLILIVVLSFVALAGVRTGVGDICAGTVLARVERQSGDDTGF